mmetsp:Transcript_15819/g.25651  ORF Transcript_15819/g.25651 Transcript_15819/m.25651 type:complete len:180 (-) Transcript_15819:342-881(-)
MDIVNELIGNRDPGYIDNDPAILTMYQIQRRSKLFRHFFRGESEGIPYKNFDIPAITAKFIDTWENVIMTSKKHRRRSFNPEDLAFVESDFCVMLVVSNIVGKFTFGGDKLLSNLSTRASRVRVIGITSPRRTSTIDAQTQSSHSHATPSTATTTRTTECAEPPVPNNQLPDNLREKIW